MTERGGRAASYTYALRSLSNCNRSWTAAATCAGRQRGVCALTATAAAVGLSSPSPGIVGGLQANSSMLYRLFLFASLEALSGIAAGGYTLARSDPHAAMLVECDAEAVSSPLAVALTRRSANLAVSLGFSTEDCDAMSIDNSSNISSSSRSSIKSDCCLSISPISQLRLCTDVDRFGPAWSWESRSKRDVQ